MAAVFLEQDLYLYPVGCIAKVWVRNLSDKPIGIDLEHDYRFLTLDVRWTKSKEPPGGTDQQPPLLKLDEKRRTELLASMKAGRGRVMTVQPGGAEHFNVSFSCSREDGQLPTRDLTVRLDGQAFVTDGKDCESLEATAPASVIVLPNPVRWIQAVLPTVRGDTHP
jgi:hypothetical protein